MIFSEYRIRGIHATKLKDLCVATKKRPALFNRYFDMYAMAAIVGVQQGKTASVIDPETDSAQIPGSVLITEHDTMVYLYRLVLLNDKKSELTDEQLIERAFKNDDNPEAFAKNMTIFNSYVLGGIDVIYDFFEKSLNNENNFFNKSFEFAKLYATSEQIDNMYK